MYVLIQINNFSKIFIILINEASDSDHSSKFADLVVVALTKEEKKKSKKSKTRNLLVSIVVFVLESYSFCVDTIGQYNPSVRIIGLVSYTTYVVCVNFIHKCWDLQFKVDSKRQIF